MQKWLSHMSNEHTNHAAMINMFVFEYYENHVRLYEFSLIFVYYKNI